MVKKPEVLVIVPARGGSKSIPRKNIKLFASHPLLSYSIAAGVQAELVNRVIVSTDDEEIATVARQSGAEVPFIRPVELAQDHTPDLPVFKHALNWLQVEQSYTPDVVVQLRPTSPVRPRGCVDRAITLLLDTPEADSVRGVVPSGQNPYKMWRLMEGGGMRPLMDGEFKEPYNMPRQQLPDTYWQTGHIDAIRVSTIQSKNSMSGEKIFPLVVDSSYSVDIDTSRDWVRAEWLVQQGNLDMVFPGATPRSFPERVELVVLDFDGVLTDNRVWVDGDGREMIAANRGDGWGIAKLTELGIEVLILSTETNPVVTARAKKLKLDVEQGISDKASALKNVLEIRKIDPQYVIYVGNDVNDLPCFPLVGYAFSVQDAHPDVLRAADYVLASEGGHGAVREVCDMIQKRN